MPVICPSITAYTADEYHQQMKGIGHFAHRLHIDLMDGKFTPKRNVNPVDAWWPVGIKADFHLMYKDPLPATDTILQHQPHMIIVHAESDGNLGQFSSSCRQHGVKVGIAVLQTTDIEAILPGLADVDHVLIFSGNLGSYGGQADLSLLSKVEKLKRHKPNLEVGWDGGINQNNISQLAFGGVDVMNVGGFIQHSANPERTFDALQRIADETGTT
jgi:ribulose-phosphate 3-epimerase